ncbi:hypothetical protein QUF74_05480 [Candidatus Halobeggiatoa sp. HSG11]|nr:hypothetical protein [Candidatus Halobeggiatoa sp. HSG11]
MKYIHTLILLILLIPLSSQALMVEEPELSMMNAIERLAEVVIDYGMDNKHVVFKPRPVEIEAFKGLDYAFQMYGSKDTKACNYDFYTLMMTCPFKKVTLKWKKAVHEQAVYVEDVEQAMGMYGEFLYEIIEEATAAFENGNSFPFAHAGIISWDEKKNLLKIKCPYTTPTTEQTKTCQKRDSNEWKAELAELGITDDYVVEEPEDEVATPNTTVDEYGEPTT